MGNVSSSLSNGEDGQFFPFQRCQLEGPHLHRNVEVCSKRENEQIINYCRHRDVFAHKPLYRIYKNFINGKMILTEKGRKYVHCHINEEERRDFLTLLKLMFAQLFQ